MNTNVNKDRNQENKRVFEDNLHEDICCVMNCS